MNDYKAEIIAVGTELLLGQIANTNAQWISQRLAENGVNVFFHGVVGDNMARVQSTFELADTRADIVIVTGGLGPTDDDMTRDAFQAITNKQLKEDPVAMEKIVAHFEKTKRPMTPNNRKQALVFDDAHVLPNRVGMAPGMIVKNESTFWVFLPGVPREMKSIMTESVLPYLKRGLELNTVIQSRMLRFIGIGESQLEHELKPIIDQQQNPTIAPLASEGEVALRLTAKSATREMAEELINQTETDIMAIVGSFFYGYDDTTVLDQVFSLLKKSNDTIGVAESLTGGKFTDSIVSLSGASEVCMGSIISYSAQSKQDVLGVSSTTIERYGTVSSQCAEEMAEKAQEKLNTTIGISFTGVAGPQKSEGKDVGTVFISIFHQSGKSITKEYNFFGDRDTIRNRAVKKGQELLYYFLNK